MKKIIYLITLFALFFWTKVNGQTNPIPLIQDYGQHLSYLNPANTGEVDNFRFHFLHSFINPGVQDGNYSGVELNQLNALSIDGIILYRSPKGRTNISCGVNFINQRVSIGYNYHTLRFPISGRHSIGYSTKLYQFFRSLQGKKNRSSRQERKRNQEEKDLLYKTQKRQELNNKLEQLNKRKKEFQQEINALESQPKSKLRNDQLKLKRLQSTRTENAILTTEKRLKDLDHYRSGQGKKVKPERKIYGFKRDKIQAKPLSKFDVKSRLLGCTGRDAGFVAWGVGLEYTSFSIENTMFRFNDQIDFSSNAFTFNATTSDPLVDAANGLAQNLSLFLAGVLFIDLDAPVAPSKPRHRRRHRRGLRIGVSVSRLFKPYLSIDGSVNQDNILKILNVELTSFSLSRNLRVSPVYTYIDQNKTWPTLAGPFKQHRLGFNFNIEIDSDNRTSTIFGMSLINTYKQAITGVNTFATYRFTNKNNFKKKKGKEYFFTLNWEFQESRQLPQVKDTWGIFRFSFICNIWKNQ